MLAFGDDPRLAQEIDQAVLSLSPPVPFENPTYCHGLSGELELSRMLAQVARHQPFAERRASEAVNLLQLLQTRDKNGFPVWHSEEPVTITPDLWVGSLGPASALALWHEKNRDALLSLGWLA